jgi:hypothetical protein
MADRWLYIHAGAAHGPVDLEKLAQVAALGKLLPTDPVWPPGEDMRSAVEAQTLLNIESFPSVQGKVEEALASPPQSASSPPDWLSDVEASSESGSASAPPYSPDVEVVNETQDVEVVNETPDVEVVNEESAPEASTPVPPPKPPSWAAASPAAPRRPVAAKGKAAPPSTPRPAQEEADDPDEEEESGFAFKRRDLLMFGLGVMGVGLAVAVGLFFGKRSQRTPDEDPPKDDRGEGKP